MSIFFGDLLEEGLEDRGGLFGLEIIRVLDSDVFRGERRASSVRLEVLSASLVDLRE